MPLNAFLIILSPFVFNSKALKQKLNKYSASHTRSLLPFSGQSLIL